MEDSRVARADSRQKVVRFDPDDPRYRCCCDCCHVTTGAKIVAFIECVVFVLAYVVTVAVYVELRPTDGHPDDTAYDSGDAPAEDTADEDADPQSFFWKCYLLLVEYLDYALLVCLICTTLGVIAMILLLVGIRKRKPLLLMPHLVCQAAWIYALLLTGGVAIYGVVQDSQKAKAITSETRSSALAILLSFLVSFLITLAVLIHFLVVVLRCCRYLHVANLYDRSLAMQALYSAPLRQSSVALYVPDVVSANTPRHSFVMQNSSS